MTNRENLSETVIYRYIIDHRVSEGERLPDPDHLAALFGREVAAVESALEACCRAEVLERSSTGGLVVRSLSEMPGQEWLSFSHSAALHGEQVKIIVREAKLRLPRVDPEDLVTTDFEKEAHQSLGLKEDEPFIVISRVRRLGSADDNAGDESKKLHPRVIHRAYLDPKRFPDNFLSAHDFKLESLVRIYNNYDYVIRRREDKIKARLACKAERVDLNIELHNPVLDMAQNTFATKQNGEEPFVLEHLRATYWNLAFELQRQNAVGF